MEPTDEGKVSAVFCSRCGARNEGQANFCHVCGASLRTVMAEPYVPPVVSPASVTSPVVRYAGFWKRFNARFIDGVILTIGGFVIVFTFGFIYGLSTGTSEGAEVLGYILYTLVGWLYYAVMESSPKQATLGKMAIGIIVTDMAGKRISFSKATGRYFAEYISLLILGIGFLMIAFTEKKQALHDIMAGCLVVDKVKRPLRFPF